MKSKHDSKLKQSDKTNCMSLDGDRKTKGKQGRESDEAEEKIEFVHANRIG